MPTNIPLAEAQVLWDYIGPDPEDNRVVRVTGPGDRIFPEYTSSWGACNLDFQEASDEQRLLMLFQNFRDLALEGIDPQEIHGAFQVIPEYRAATHPSLIAAAYDEIYQ